MNISGVSKALFDSNNKSDNYAPRTVASDATVVAKDTGAQPKKIDMRNVSLNEINMLIKSGVEGLLDVLPFVDPQIIYKHGSDYAANIKVDFLGQVEGSIKSQKSRGEDTSFMEKVLANLKRIDGTTMPSPIDVVV